MFLMSGAAVRSPGIHTVQFFRDWASFVALSDQTHIRGTKTCKPITLYIEPFAHAFGRSRNYFTDHLKKLWTKLFEATLPPIRTQLSESVNNLLANFSQAVIKISDDICPEIHGSVQSVAQSITQQGLVLQEAYELGWDGKLASGRGDTHRSLRRQLQEFMTEAYEDAAIETGELELPIIPHWILH